MKNTLFFLLLLCGCSFCPLSAQDVFALRHGCAFDDDLPVGQLSLDEPSSEAEAIVEEIMGLIDLKNNFVLKAGNIANACATSVGDRRFILYNPDFLKTFDATPQQRWAAYFVLAHEIGHHLNGDRFETKDPQKRRQMELEADLFATGTLCRFGARLEEVLLALDSFAQAEASEMHPGREDRKAACKKRWTKRKLEMQQNGENANPPKRLRFSPVFAFDYKVEKVEGGSLVVGCFGKNCRESETPARAITLEGFWIGAYEVTQAQWKAVMGTNPSAFTSCDDCPVDNVSWEGARDFIARLNAMTGRRYRLPTEAEWEYAARGGQKMSGQPLNLYETAWCGMEKTPHPVGKKMPNALMLYDMLGNIAEWCEEAWHENYTEMLGDGNWGKAGDPNEHPLRGGSWGMSALSVGPTCRYPGKIANAQTGLRLILDQK